MIIHPFSVSGNTVNLSATDSSSRVELTAQGDKTVRVYNSGTETVFINFGDSAVTAATASGLPVPGGVVEAFAAGDVTHAAGITSTGSSTVYFTSGRGA